MCFSFKMRENFCKSHDFLNDLWLKKHSLVDVYCMQQARAAEAARLAAEARRASAAAEEKKKGI